MINITDVPHVLDTLLYTDGRHSLYAEVQLLSGTVNYSIRTAVRAGVIDKPNHNYQTEVVLARLVNSTLKEAMQQFNSLP
jgi:hypothetical protein